MSPNRSPDSPALWIVAGANGSGKSTAYERVTIDAPSGGVWFINPDALAQRIADHERLPLNPDANLEAVGRIERWLYASVDAHQTVGVETVLATGKYQKLVEHARAQGFRVDTRQQDTDSPRRTPLERVPSVRRNAWKAL